MGTSPGWRQASRLNPADVSGGNEAQLLGQVFETAASGDPDADCYAIAIYSGQSFETLDTQISGPPGFVRKLTHSGNSINRVASGGSRVAQQKPPVWHHRIISESEQHPTRPFKGDAARLCRPFH
jgi:hypothetical protein